MKLIVVDLPTTKELNLFGSDNFYSGFREVHFDHNFEKIDENDFLVNRYRRGLETCQQAKKSKSGHAIFFSFFPTRSSYEYDSAPSLKYSCPLLDVFACIG